MGTYSFTHRKIVQGFSIGGEYSGAAIFVAEYSPDRKRGFMGSWLDFGSIAGFCTWGCNCRLDHTRRG